MQAELEKFETYGEIGIPGMSAPVHSGKIFRRLFADSIFTDFVHFLLNTFGLKCFNALQTLLGL
jgi:hypothetical protein